MPVQDLKQLYLKNGLAEMLRGIGRFFYFNTPIRDIRSRLLLQDGGSIITCSIGSASAQFNVTNWAELDRFDTAFGLAELSEQSVIESLLEDIEDDTIFYDVGANVGLYTCLVGNMLESGSVHAFEPHPTNISRLQQNIELNNLAEVAEVHDFALSDSSGEFDLAVRVSSEAAEGRHSLVVDSDIGETVPVSTYSGDHLVGSELQVPDVIKIDVEEAEYRVVQGLNDTIRKYKPIIYCELHIDQLEQDGVSVDSVINQLTDVGYDIESLYERTSSTKFIKAVPDRDRK